MLNSFSQETVEERLKSSLTVYIRSRKDVSRSQQSQTEQVNAGVIQPESEEKEITKALYKYVIEDPEHNFGYAISEKSLRLNSIVTLPVGTEVWRGVVLIPK